MQTQHLGTGQPDLQTAAHLLKNGDVVAFPTETVYGLGALISQPEAVQKIFQAKGRPSDNPLIIHVAELAQVWPLLGEISDQQRNQINDLAMAFWPGPLTLILPKSSSVPEAVTASQPTLAIRIPSHPIAQTLIKLADGPIAAPSANTSGLPSPTTAQHVIDDLEGKIAAVIDSGPTTIGIESTVLDLTQQPPRILRPGHITQAELETVLQIPVIEDVITQAIGPVSSPGMKYRHYAPQAKIIVVTPEQLSSLVIDNQTLLLSNLPSKHALLRPLNAATLFANFRWADRNHLTTIVVVVDQASEQQTGLMNRLLKAAAK